VSPRDGNKYKTPAGFSDYTIRGNYQSKDTTDVVLNVKVSRHGPVMNGLITGLDDNKPVAIFFIHNNPFIFSMRFTLFHMQNKADFQGVALISAPGLNVMYGVPKEI
jgi:penicillin amidase